MAQKAQLDAKAGNTKPSRIRARAWCFTLNNPEKNEAQLEQELKKNGATKFIFQKEKGESETPHFQGVVYFENPRDFNAVRKIFDEKAHIEKCKNWKNSVNYCKKSETQIGETIKFGLPRDLQLIEPKGWQLEIIDLIKTEPDWKSRKINWFWEPNGNVGKTAIAKYICAKYPKSIFVSGKASDVKFAVCKFLDKNEELDICIFHFVRSMEQFISYQAIEEILDGIFFSGKYEAEMKIFNPPHVICFANFEPDLTKCSVDRWKIRYINGIEKLGD